MADPIIPLGDHQPACYASHLGLWLYEPGRFDQAVDAYRSGALQPIVAVADDRERREEMEARRREAAARKLEPIEIMAQDWDMPVALTEDRIAVVRMSGTMMKRDSKYGGVNTMRVRQVLRAASSSSKVQGIMIHMDEVPGGHVSGTDELGADVRGARAHKPLAIHSDDLIASAGYWVGAQAPIGRLTMNAMGEAGSIGVLAAVVDSSEAMAMKGFKVIRVATGPRKGDFLQGVEVDKAAIAKLQDDVDRIGEVFFRTVAEGRGMTMDKVREIATGETYGAEESRKLGLIDEIMSFDDAMGVLRSDIAQRAETGARRSRAVAARVAIAESM